VGQASLPVIDARSATITKIHRSIGPANEPVWKLGYHLCEFLRHWFGGASRVYDRQGRLSHYF